MAVADGEPQLSLSFARHHMGVGSNQEKIVSFIGLLLAAVVGLLVFWGHYHSVKPMRVLITAGGSVTALSVLKGLRLQCEIPVHLVLADAQEANAGRYFADEFVAVPAATDPACLEVLQALCCEQKIDLFIPIVDAELLQVSEKADSFMSHGTRVAISLPNVISTCADKLAFVQEIVSLGLPVANTYRQDEIGSANVSFPLFVKPRRGGRSSIGAQKVDNRRELEWACEHLDDPLIQEFIDGEEYTVDTLCDFEGRFIAGISRIRLETKGGVSVKGCTVDLPELIQMVKKITEALPVFGPANVQFLRRRDGSLAVSELNARFAGTLALSLASGFNSPFLLLKLVRGERIEPHQLDLRYGVKMFRYWQEVFVLNDGRIVTDPWPLAKHTHEHY